MAGMAQVGVAEADGMMECWKSGIMGYRISSFQYFNIPVFRPKDRFAVCVIYS
jgi:hypothetical protein